MKKLREPKPPLPPEPLMLAHGRTVPGPAMDGASLLPQVPPDRALTVMRAYRMLRMWARWPWRVDPFLRNARATREWERAALTAVWREGHREHPDEEYMGLMVPLSLLIGFLTRAGDLEGPEVVERCTGVMNWAADHDAEEVAVAFPELAALIWADNCRPAWIAGKIFRFYGRMREAEYWLRRAERIATWTEDWEGKARALNSIGNIHLQKGRFERATDLYQRGLRIARRNGLKSLEGELLHDLFIVASVTQDLRRAEEYARGAYNRYRPDHPRLPALAHDVAYFWIGRGHYSRALDVLQAVLPHIEETREQFRVLANTSRAAAGCGTRALFERLWFEIWELFHRLPEGEAIGTALVELGVGAACLEHWEDATEALERAIAVARTTGESDVLIRAESVLQKVRSRELVEITSSRGSSTNAMASSFAMELVTALREMPIYQIGSPEAVEGVAPHDS